MGTILQPAENRASEGGGGFNPRKEPSKSAAASAEEGHFSGLPLKNSPSSAPGCTPAKGLFPRNKPPRTIPEAALILEFCSTSLLKNAEPSCFVKGHDFSRADKAHKIIRALAPAETLPHQLRLNKVFFNKFLK
jgi:hypothetical protein